MENKYNLQLIKSKVELRIQGISGLQVTLAAGAEIVLVVINEGNRSNVDENLKISFGMTLITSLGRNDEFGQKIVSNLEKDSRFSFTYPDDAKPITYIAISKIMYEDIQTFSN